MHANQTKPTRMVKRSRLRSATDVPPIAVDIPPPNKSDIPPPRPLWSRTNIDKIRLVITAMTESVMIGQVINGATITGAF